MWDRDRAISQPPLVRLSPNSVACYRPVVKVKRGSSIPPQAFLSGERTLGGAFRRRRGHAVARSSDVGRGVFPLRSKPLPAPRRRFLSRPQRHRPQRRRRRPPRPELLNLEEVDGGVKLHHVKQVFHSRGPAADVAPMRYSWNSSGISTGPPKLSLASRRTSSSSS